MSIPDKYYLPLLTAVWMIALPVMFWFFAGAGAGTVFNGFASLLGTMFAIFGGASLILGAVLMAWCLWQVWRQSRRIPDEV